MCWCWATISSNAMPRSSAATRKIEAAIPPVALGNSPALDFLRGLAALGVFLCHMRGSSFVEYGALPAAEHNPIVAILFLLTRLGREAVLVFFVLSGHLVFGQIIKRCEAGQFDIRNYCIDRATRIFVPLIPACILTAALTHFVFGSGIDLGQVLANVIGLNGVLAPTLGINAPLWTLAYEIWFYVVGGALGYLICRRSGAVLGLIPLAAGTAVFSVLDARYLLYWSLAGLGVWFLRIPRRGPIAVMGCLILLLGVVCVELGLSSKSFGTLKLVPTGVAEFLVCGGLIMALPFLVDPLTSARLIWLRKPAHLLSEISFSLYLFHYPVNVCLDVIFPKAPSLSGLGIEHFLLRILISGGVAILFYAIFERNTPRLRRYLRQKFSGPIQLPEAVAHPSL